MTLRTRLFLIFGGLVATLVLAQWWLTRTLTRDLRSEVDVVANSVATSTAAVFIDQNCADPPCVEEERSERVRVIRLGAGDPRLDWVDRGDGSIPDLMREILGQEAGTLDPELLERLHEVDPDRRPKVLSYSFEYSSSQSDGTRRVERVRRQLEHERSGAEHNFLALHAPGLQRSFAIPESGLLTLMEGFSRNLVLGSLAVLLCGLLLTVAVAYRVSRPLRQLANAARELGDGALGTQVATGPDGEVGEALEAFNSMSRRIAELDAETRRLAERQHLGEIGEIARALAHSLRNPLNALGLSIEELAAREGADGTDLADSARRQVRRIDDSIRSFLALASQGGGRIEALDLVALLRDVGLEALQDARGRVGFDVVDSPMPMKLRAIEPELRAVVQALVVNAVEASPEGGLIEASIEAENEAPIEAVQQPERFRVSISDRGPGLSDDLRERLFTPHLTTKARGSGMGLYLAQRIAQTRYGGTLELLDRAGGGTTAVLVLGARAEESEGSSREEVTDV